MGFRSGARHDLPLTLSSLNDDVMLEVCDYLAVRPRLQVDRSDTDSISTPLKNLSLVNRRFRALLRPILLKSIALCEHRKATVTLPDGWDIARKAIDGLLSDALLVYTVKSLRLDLYGHVWENEYALAEEVAHIATFLRQLPNLQLLCLNIPHPYMLAFETAFKSGAGTSPSTFNNLTALSIEYRMIFLLDYCPHLERLALYNNHDNNTRLYQLNLARLASYAPRITQFEAHAQWTATEIAYLASMFPSLHYLALLGYRGWPSLSAITTAVGRGFKQLRVLVLPDVELLRVGFLQQKFPKPHGRPGMEEYWGKYLEKKNRVEDRVAGMAFGACGRLDECWLGEHAVARIIGRDNHGDGGGDDVRKHKCVEQPLLRSDTNDKTGYGTAGNEEDKEADTTNDDEQAEEMNGIRWEWTRDEFLERKGRLLTMARMSYY